MSAGSGIVVFVVVFVVVVTAMDAAAIEREIQDVAPRFALTFLDAIGAFTFTVAPRSYGAATQCPRDESRVQAVVGLFKRLSTATASRDLLAGVAAGQLVRRGERALTRYRFV